MDDIKLGGLTTIVDGRLGFTGTIHQGENPIFGFHKQLSHNYETLWEIWLDISLCENDLGVIGDHKAQKRTKNEYS